ncbi:MAG TPA: hypothetical protein VD973_23830 [Symbiobacteriaceae bacterium]|nr:hypothetical protein [Symbiobacteriaceae bacterium]
MSVPHRKDILDALDRWFQSHSEGPTLAELCAALGWPADRRGSLQRWLTALKGQDVEWEPRKRRSLRLVKPCQVSETTPKHEEMPWLVRDERLLALCATAVYDWLETSSTPRTDIVGNGPLATVSRARLPLSLRLALSTFDLALMVEGKRPLTLEEFLNLMSIPVSQWPVVPQLENLDPESVILESGSLTEFAEYWVLHHKGFLHEWQESIMLQVLETCREQRLYDAYRSYRQLLIEKPVMPVAVFQQLLVKPEFYPIKKQLRAMYVDVSLLDGEDEPGLCPRCGYLQKRLPSGLWICRSRECEQVCEQQKLLRRQTIGDPAEWVAISPGMHRYVTIPGLHELSLAQALTDMGLRVELWPEVDRYDLYVSFPSGERWALDVKNWDYLGRTTLSRWPVHRSPIASMTAVVFPDDRRHLHLDKVRSLLEPQLDGVRLYWSSEILRLAAERRMGHA